MMTGIMRDRKPAGKYRLNSAKLARGYTLTARVCGMKRSITIIISPSIRPGTAPAMNSLPMDSSAITPKMTIGIDGGMMGPMVEDAAVTAAEKVPV